MRRYQIFKIEPKKGKHQPNFYDLSRKLKPSKGLKGSYPSGIAEFRSGRWKLRLFKISNTHFFFFVHFLEGSPLPEIQTALSCAAVRKRSVKPMCLCAGSAVPKRCQVYFSEADLSTGCPQVFAGISSRPPVQYTTLCDDCQQLFENKKNPTRVGFFLFSKSC